MSGPVFGQIQHTLSPNRLRTAPPPFAQPVILLLALYADGSKAGMTAESVKAASRLGSKQMSLEEARMILNIEPNAEWEDIMKVSQEEPWSRPCCSLAMFPSVLIHANPA